MTARDSPALPVVSEILAVER